MMEITEIWAQQEREALTARNTAAIMSYSVFYAIVIVILILFVFLILRQTTSSIKEVTKSLDELSNGNLRYEFPDEKDMGKDEIGQICDRIIEGCTDVPLCLGAWKMKAILLHAEGKAVHCGHRLLFPGRHCAKKPLAPPPQDVCLAQVRQFDLAHGFHFLSALCVHSLPNRATQAQRPIRSGERPAPHAPGKCSIFLENA